MSILVDDSNKTACRAAEAGLQQKNCAALVRPAGTGKGCIVWELLDAHPEMRVLWVVSCAARLELRRALTKRLGRTLDGRVRLMSCEQLAVQNALGWVPARPAGAGRLEGDERKGLDRLRPAPVPPLPGGKAAGSGGAGRPGRQLPRCRGDAGRRHRGAAGAGRGDGRGSAAHAGLLYGPALAAGRCDGPPPC